MKVLAQDVQVIVSEQEEQKLIELEQLLHRPPSKNYVSVQLQLAFAFNVKVFWQRVHWLFELHERQFTIAEEQLTQLPVEFAN